MQQTDTNQPAREVLTHLYRKMPLGTKLLRVFQAYQTGKMLKMAGLRYLYPDATEKQIWQLWAKQHLGEELFNKAYPEASDQIANLQKHKDLNHRAHRAHREHRDIK